MVVSYIRRPVWCSDRIGCDVPLPLAIVEELLARDLVVLDRVDADLFERDPLASGVGRNVEGEVDGELVGAVEERTAGLFAADGVVGLPVLGLLDDRCLAGGFFAAGFDGHDVGRAYIACITPKFLPWSRNSTAVL